MTTTLATRDSGVSPFGAQVLEHFAIQIASARRLLTHVLDEGRAVRARDPEGVLDQLAAIQAEMELRGGLEHARHALLTHAGARLGIPAHAVTLDAMADLLGEQEAADARLASAELRGLLEEVAREHRFNRQLMRQELAFLDHLVRLVGDGEQESGTYSPRASSLRAFDLEA